MVEKISDLIAMNSQAALIPGVQLEWYGNPDQEAANERLVSSYIFSSGAATQGAASAVTIFERIRDSLKQPDTHNIFTVIAHYGHGKSHFALIMANYFGRRAGDPVLGKLLDQLEACTNQNTAYHFRQFKKNVEKPQLVVRLSGADFMNLRQGFLNALRRALDEHETTRGYALKAVSERAAKWLRGLSPEQRERAAKWLDEMHHIDFEAFVEKLEGFDTTKDMIARELSREILGIPADFGSDVNLREIIDQVVNDLCHSKKPDAPFYRMVILFDEMGQYAEKWCHNRMAAGDLAPQQLTEACDNWKGEICLVAFLQRHMDSFVKQYGAEGEFKKWAERFPHQTSFRLESSLEKVIAGLLSKQDSWTEFARNFMPKIEAASKAAWQMLPTYQKSEKWKESGFNAIVGVGAFPLHPLTTGLLCNLTFTQGSRTIIGFVDAAFQAVKDEPAARGGQLQWVWPIRLVDEFAGDFADQASFGRYEHAVTRLGANSPEHLYQVIKALFLYEIGGVKKYPSQAHATVLAALCGLPESQVRDALKQLDEDHSIIRFVKAKSEYEFCEVGMSRADIRQQLQRAVAEKTVSSLAEKISKLKLPGKFPFPESKATGYKGEYGLEGDEWRLKPVMVDAAKLSVERLAQIVNERADSAEARGLLVYAVSGDDAELDLARNRATTALNELRNSRKPFPVVIAVPQKPALTLGRELLMRDELNGWGTAKIAQYGPSYDDAVKDSDRRIEDELKEHFCNSIRYFVAPSVEHKLKSHEKSVLDHIVNRLFEDAFPNRVPARCAVVKTGNAQGNSIVAMVSRHLIVNEVDPSKLEQKHKNLISSVLQEGSDRWGILTLGNKLKAPSHERVIKAWEWLNAEIPEDRPVEFRRLSAALKGMPFGFDDLTLTLLYSAWIGLHKHELRFAGMVNLKDERFQTLSLAQIQEQMKKATDFIAWLDDGRVQVTRPGKGNKRKAREYLSKLSAAASFQDAFELINRVEEILSTIGPDDELRGQIMAQVEKLVAECGKVQKYEKEVLFVRGLAEKRERAIDLIGFADKLPTQPETSLAFDNKTLSETKSLIEARLQSLVERQAQQKLKKIESHDAIVKDLEQLKDALHRSGRESLEHLCIEALARIESEYKALKAEQAEEAIVAGIESFRVADAGLAACRDMAAAVRQTLEEKLAHASDKAGRKIEAVQQQINRHILNCEEWVAGLPESIAAAKDAVQFKALRDEIIKRTVVYADTPEETLLLECKEQVEAKAGELAETAQRQAIRQTQINAHFSLVKERAARVIQAPAFAEAVREFAHLLPLPAPPDGVSFTAEEEREQQTHLDQAQQRITTLFNELTAANTPQTAAGFEQRQAQLQLSLEAINAVSSLPAEWRRQLSDMAEANSRAYEDWQVEQRKEEEARRLAQENERRQENNRKLVDGPLKQGKSAQSLREIQNAVASLNDARAALEPPCDEQVEQIERALRDLGEREETIRGWVKEILPERLAAAWAVGETQELRQKIVSYESRCEGDATLAAALDQARLRLDERGAFLTELAALEKNVTSISHCHEKLTRLEGLRETCPDGEPLTAEAGARLREKLAQLQAEQRAQAERWLAQFNVALEQDLPAKDASALLRKLQDRPAGLEERDEPFIEQVDERLKLTLDRDKVARIVEDFRGLQTAEQRAECLLRIAELCRAEGLPEATAGRLASLLEMGAAV
jgi:hypothetical protein